MVLTARLASAVDFLEVVDPAGFPAVRKTRLFGRVAGMVAGSEAVTLRDEAGALVCVAGLHETQDLPGQAEAWLATGAALKANLWPALEMLRQALALVARSAPGLTVTAYQDPRGVAGDRLARLFGFNPDGVTDSAIGPLRIWRRRL